MGFDVSDDNATYTFTNTDPPKSGSQPPARPPPPKSGAQPGKTQSSIYRLISQKPGPADKPNFPRSESAKRVQFEEGDSFDSTDGEDLVPHRQQGPPVMSTEEDTDDMDYTDTQSEETTTQDESDFPAENRKLEFLDDSDSDDVSLSAFVPASVRRQSVLPHRPDEQDPHRLVQQKTQHPVASVPAGIRHQSTTNLRKLAQDDSSSSLDSESSASTSQSSLDQPPRRRGNYDDSDEGDEQGVSDLLDEAIGQEDDTEDEVVYRHKTPVAAPVSVVHSYVWV